MPHLRNFLRSGSPLERTQKVRAILSGAKEVICTFQSLSARRSAVARAIFLRGNQEAFQAALAQEGAPKKLQLPRMRQDVFAEAERDLRADLQPSAEACTALRFGKEVGSMVLHH